MITTGNNILLKKFYIPSIVFVTLLAGCEGGLETIGDEITVDSRTEKVERDVLAPEAFKISDRALWDGRPTFGGVWIAYPDIDVPERVRITNPANGKTVIGALYKREREFPGPKIELSADAASALGVLAGTPADLTVVAMRREEVEVDVPDAGPKEITTPERRPGSEPVVAGVPTPDIPVPTPSVAAGTPDVTAVPLPSTDGAKPEETAVAASPAPAPASSGPNFDTEMTFIQVATTRTREQANEVYQKLLNAGLGAQVREVKSNGRTRYQVIAGPANSKESLDFMMKVVRDLGYKDAIKLR